MNDPLSKIHEICTENHFKIAVLESGCGGEISREIVLRGGASSWFDSGHVLYSGTSKLAMGMDYKIHQEFGSVSEQVAMNLATKYRNKMGLDYVLCEMSFLPPRKPESKSTKPFQMCVAVAGERETHSEVFYLPSFLTWREDAASYFASCAMDFLLEFIDLDLVWR